MKTDDTSKQERAALLVISEAVLEDYFAEIPHFLSPEARKEWTLLQAYMAKRKQALLSPAPRKPAKPRKPKAIAPMPVDTERGLTVVPVPTGLQHTSDVRKRSRRDG
jgi:hypothetical protein